MMLLRLVVCCLFTLWAMGVEATVYYVATTGNDGNAGTSTSAPWRTIQKAANTVNAGDVVNIRTGTYAEHVLLTRSGTPTSPITFQPYQSELPIMEGASVGVGAGFETNGACNVILKGLEIRNYNIGSGIGSNVYFHDCSSNASVSRISGVHTHHSSGVDNPAGVWVHAYRGTLEIDNNKTHDNSGSANNINNTGIVVFADTLGSGATFSLTVRNNEVYNENMGIKFKHAGGAGSVITAILEKNVVHDISGVDSQLACIGTEQNGTIIRMNICYNLLNNIDAPAIAVGNQGGGGAGANVVVTNNVGYNVTWGVYVPDTSHGANLNAHDNIWFGRSGGGYPDTAGYCLTNLTGLTGLAFDFFAGAFTSKVDAWGCWNGSTYDTLALLVARGFGGGSLTGNPLFVNPTGTPPDFRLQASSPARNVGTGGLDMGAYPTRTEIIGPTPTGQDTSVPSPPLNITAQ